MPKLINVSATFNNCAFHSIAAHLLANQERTHELGIFDKLFDRPKGESELVDLFSDSKAFNDFFTQLRRQKAIEHPDESAAGETFEKVFILGFALRNYLKQMLLNNEQVKQQSQERFVELVHATRQQLVETGCTMSDLLPYLMLDADGVMLDATQNVFNRADFNSLSDDALRHFWAEEGAEAYAKKVGTEDVLVSHRDITFLCYALGVPFTMHQLDNSQPLSLGREIATFSVDEAEERPLLEPLTLLLDDEHYKIQLDDDKAFAAVFERDNALYNQAREECMALPIETSYKSWIAQFVTPLIFLPSVLSKDDQSIPAKDSFLNAIKDGLAFDKEHANDASIHLPLNAITLRKRNTTAIQPLDVDPLIEELFNAVLTFMVAPVHASNPLYKVKNICNGSLYREQYGAGDPTANALLEQRLKSMPLYQESYAFVQLLSNINKLSPQDRLPLKCALHALFMATAPQAKTAVCKKLMAMASFMSGARDELLQQISIALFALCTIAAIILAATTGFIGVGIGFAVISTAFCGMLYYTGCASGASGAMIDFVNECTKKATQEEETFSFSVV